jgi:hypothetical protein
MAPESEWQSAESLLSRGGVASSSQSPPLVEEEGPISKHAYIWTEKITSSRFPKEQETKNDCADEDQQLFTGLDWIGLEALRRTVNKFAAGPHQHIPSSFWVPSEPMTTFFCSFQDQFMCLEMGPSFRQKEGRSFWVERRLVFISFSTIYIYMVEKDIYIYIYSYVRNWFIIVITQFKVTIATNFRGKTFVEDLERVKSFVSVYRDSSVSIDNVSIL